MPWIALILHRHGHPRLPRRPNLMLAIRDRWPPIELLMIGSDPYQDTELPVCGVLLSKPFNARKIVAAIRDFCGLD